MSYNPAAGSTPYWWDFTEPVEGDFSWVNQGTATIDDSLGGDYLLQSAEAGTNLRMRVKSQPSTPYTITAAFIPMVSSYAGVFPGVGLLFRESGTSKVITFSYTMDTQIPYVRVQKWTNETTFSANDPGAYERTWGMSTGPFIWMRLTNDAAVLTWQVSNDGRTWHQLLNKNVNDFFTTAPDQVGFFVHPNSATFSAAMWLVHWEET